MPNKKAKIVLESLSTSANMAKLCRRYNLHPRTVYTWKERFIENGKVGFSRKGKNPIAAAKKENDDLKRFVGKQALVIDSGTHPRGVCQKLEDEINDDLGPKYVHEKTPKTFLIRGVHSTSSSYRK